MEQPIKEEGNMKIEKALETIRSQEDQVFGIYIVTKNRKADEIKVIEGEYVVVSEEVTKSNQNGEFAKVVVKRLLKAMEEIIG